MRIDMDGNSAICELPIARRSIRDGAGATSAVGRPIWLAFLGVTLLGYAVVGKIWAYVGIAPIYVGEMVLICGLISFVLYGQGRGMLKIPAVWPLLALL